MFNILFIEYFYIIFNDFFTHNTNNTVFIIIQTANVGLVTKPTKVTCPMSPYFTFFLQDKG